jgi:gluconate 5-dehydrogenase
MVAGRFAAALEVTRAQLDGVGQFSVAGRVALVTGAAQGLGFEIARALAEAGATVVLNGRSRASLDESADRLVSAGLNADVSVFDVADGAAVSSELEQVRQLHGTVDILVCNVGHRARSLAADLDELMLLKTLETNVVASFRLARQLVDAMAAQGWGRLIFLSSVAAQHAAPLTLAYGASKAALESMTRSFAIEYSERGVTTNAISPGNFATETNRAYAAAPGMSDRIPARRWGEPREISGAALLLASPAGSYINGTVLTVDGGVSAILSTYAPAPITA